MHSFDPSSIPNLKGCVAIVTGGHTGLGFGTAFELANKGARVYIASRSKTKVDAAINEIKKEVPSAELEFLQLDLSDLASVSKAADEFLKRETSLHILVNNAGVMCTPYSTTPQGYENQFATNYLGHFLLTLKLIPILLHTAEQLKMSSNEIPLSTVRIVNVSSSGHSQLAPKEGIMFNDINMENQSTWTRYGHSKLANVLHAKELAKKYGDQGILAMSLHPGTVKTDLSVGPRSTTPLYRLIQPLVEFRAPGPRKGAYTTLYCATSPELTQADNGAYFTPVGKRTKPSKNAEDPAMAKKLWDWTVQELKNHGFS